MRDVKQLFQRYSLIITFVIALLHSFTPHSHIQRDATDLHSLQKHEEQHPIKGFLQHAFEVNLGTHHLENFLKSQDAKLLSIDCAFVGFDVKFVFSVVFFFAAVLLFVSKDSFFVSSFHALHLQLRAPPFEV